MRSQASAWDRVEAVGRGRSVRAMLVADGGETDPGVGDDGGGGGFLVQLGKASGDVRFGGAFRGETAAKQSCQRGRS